MTKLRAILLTLFAALALTVVASASASAHEFLVQKTKITDIHLKDLLELGTTNRLHGTPFGVSTTIQCEHRHIGEALLTTGGAGSATLEFEGCTVEKPANCIVAEPITSKVTSLLEEVGGALVTKFSPASGTTFVEIELKDKSATETCSIKNKPFKVEGTQTCELPEASVELVVHTLACKTSGSALKAGGKEATFESSAASLEVEKGVFEGGTTFGASVEWSGI